MKKILFIVSALYLTSCNIPEDALNEDVATSKTGMLINALSEEDPKQSTEKTQNTSLIFKAVGFEPGWLIEIYNNKAKAVLNYGGDTITINNDFSKIKKGENFAFDAKVNNQSVSILIDNAECKDEATGDKKDAKVVFTLNNEKYNACGVFN